jgi:hypothetical protein
LADSAALQGKSKKRKGKSKKQKKEYFLGFSRILNGSFISAALY